MTLCGQFVRPIFAAYIQYRSFFMFVNQLGKYISIILSTNFVWIHCKIGKFEWTFPVLEPFYLSIIVEAKQMLERPFGQNIPVFDMTVEPQSKSNVVQKKVIFRNKNI